MEAKLTDLVERLKKRITDSLVSVILYGSGAGGDHHDNFQRPEFLCVLKQVTPRELAESEPVFNWWRGQGQPVAFADERRGSANLYRLFPHRVS